MQVAFGRAATPELAVEHLPVRDQQTRRAFDEVGDAGKAAQPRNAAVGEEHRGQRGRAGEMAGVAGARQAPDDGADGGGGEVEERQVGERAASPSRSPRTAVR